MNKSFRLVWSESRKAYVTASEFAKAHGKKSSKAVLAVSAALTAMLSAPAFAAYTDPGVIGDKASWETEEYKADWGLAAMNASTAYSLGFNGSGVAVGIMDSGALMQTHPDLAGDRFHAVTVDGQSYGSSGNRYPQHTVEDGLYEPGAKVPVSGQWQAGMNDSHGTHVTGTVGGNRDGVEFHGVAWGSDVYVGNTGGTDDTNYGPFQDPQFFYQGWNAIASDISEANKFADGETRGGFINNSFGTNIRVDPAPDTVLKGPDGGTTTTHFPTNTVSQTEYEYFLFMKDAEARKNADSRWNGKSFVDAAYEAVADKKVVQVFTTGNRDFANPFYRPLYPYFNPEAEKNWVAVAAIEQDGEGYDLRAVYNEAGNAKWWTVAAPGRNIYSSKVDLTEENLGKPIYALSSGTSMAAPHVSGALAVLMSRYDQMDALQVRDVMLTTASHTNPDGSNFAKWTAADGEVDVRFGWGVPDLEKGMYGPGQFLGKFDYKMAAGSLDVWSNDISQTALEQREREELAWKAAAEKWLANPTADLANSFTQEEMELLGDVQLTNERPVVGLTEDQQTISEEDAIAWRKAYYQKRLDAINAKIKDGLYEGSLVKRGEGTLVMTGSNSYTGGTTVEEGTLLGFTESFGSGTVNVNGGKFGIVSKYQDDFTQKGLLQSAVRGRAPVEKANVSVNNGGTLLVAMNDDVQYGSLTFSEGSKLEPTFTEEEFESVLNGETLEGSVTADSLTGADKVSVEQQSYAFIDTTVETDGNKLTAKIQKNGKTAEDFADNANEAAAAAAFVGSDFAAASADAVKGTIHSLGNPLHVDANANMMFTGAGITKTVRDHSGAQTAELADGNGRLWISGIGSFGTVEQTGFHDIDAQSGGVLVGLETSVTPAHTFGVMAGAGKTSLKAEEDGKISANDWYLGLYGESQVSDFTLGYGVQYTIQDRDAKQTLQYNGILSHAAPEYKSKMISVYGEVAYNGFKTEKAEITPYAGLIYQHVDTDDFSSSLGGMTVKTEFDKQNAVLLTAGVRGAVPFKAGTVDMKVKGDLGWNQYVGDRKAESRVTIGSSTAKIESEKLKGFANVGLGLETSFSKTASLTVGYQGLIGSSFKSHGFGATVKVGF